jgi:choline-sulfatase
MDKRPNILIILTDQLRTQAVGAYGNDLVRTPNIDRLAREGVCFEHGITNNPVCVPARSILLSGQYGRTCTGSLHNDAPIWPLNPSRQRLLDPTLPEVLQRNGYDTAVIGKWHIDPAPDLIGFDHSVLPISFGSHPWFSEDGGPLFDVYLFAQDYELHRFKEYVSQERDQPFFLYYNIYSPHMPLLDVPLTYQRMYDPDQIDLSPNVRSESELPYSTMWYHTYLWEHHYARKGGREPILDQLPDGFGLRDLIALYYGSVTWVDDIVGEIVQTLQEHELLEDTVILFTSDHGDNLGSHQVWNKDRFWEESIRIPVVFYAPGQLVPQHNTAHQAQLVDMMPTILDLCGVRVPECVQGRSFLPVLHGDTPTLGDNLSFVETGMYELAVRSPDFKFAVRADKPSGGLDPWLRSADDDTPVFLFDLRADPYELENLADSREYAEIRESLRSALSEWDRSTVWRRPRSGDE